MPARKLTKVEVFYVTAHRDSKTDREIADDLGVSLKVVRSQLKKMAAITPPAEATPASTEAAVTPPKPQLFFFEHESGAVCQTSAQTQADDERHEKAPNGYNPKFFDTVKSGIHVIDANKPIR